MEEALTELIPQGIGVDVAQTPTALPLVQVCFVFPDRLQDGLDCLTSFLLCLFLYYRTNKFEVLLALAVIFACLQFAGAGLSDEVFVSVAQCGRRTRESLLTVGEII